MKHETVLCRDPAARPELQAVAAVVCSDVEVGRSPCCLLQELLTLKDEEAEKASRKRDRLHAVLQELGLPSLAQVEQQVRLSLFEEFPSVHTAQDFSLVPCIFSVCRARPPDCPVMSQ